MSRSANRRRFLRAAALLVLAPVFGSASPLCTPQQYTRPEKYCDFAPDLFLNRRLEPSGSADLPRVNGIALAVPQRPRKPEAVPPSRLPGRVLGAGILLLLWGGLIALGVRLALPFLRSLKQPACPNCGTAEIRISFPDGLVDRVLGLFSCSPYRCKVCYYRFHKMPLSGRADLVSHPPKASGS